MAALAETAQEGLHRRGWARLPAHQVEDDGGERLLALVAALGGLYLAPGRSEAEPLVRTRAAAGASPWEPYNQLGRIGWHGDFCTVEARPRWSLVWVRVVTEPAGDWGVARWEGVVAELGQAAAGRSALALLDHTPLPFCYAPRTPVRWDCVLGAGGLRFDGRALRLGLEQHPVAGALEAVAAVEAAADRVGERLPAGVGDVLICDNRRVLHDRQEQGPGRQVVLAFAS